MRTILLMILLTASVCLVTAYRFRVPSFGFGKKRSHLQDRAIESLLDAVKRPQSQSARKRVQGCLDSLVSIAAESPDDLRLPLTGGSWRTIWTTVTADSLLGTLLQLPTSNILGGESWQVISDDLSESENVVYWKLANTRMAGLASIKPTMLSKDQPGFDLIIKGLEFRWGSNVGNPEGEYGLIGADADCSISSSQKGGKAASQKRRLASDGAAMGKRWNVFSLPESSTLSNGVGKLEILFNDGTLRITRENTQKLTYIHIKEPVRMLS